MPSSWPARGWPSHQDRHDGETRPTSPREVPRLFISTTPDGSQVNGASRSSPGNWSGKSASDAARRRGTAALITLASVTKASASRMATNKIRRRDANTDRHDPRRCSGAPAKAAASHIAPEEIETAGRCPGSANEYACGAKRAIAARQVAIPDLVIPHARLRVTAQRAAGLKTQRWQKMLHCGRKLSAFGPASANRAASNAWSENEFDNADCRRQRLYAFTHQQILRVLRRHPALHLPGSDRPDRGLIPAVPADRGRPQRLSEHLGLGSCRPYLLTSTAMTPIYGKAVRHLRPGAKLLPGRGWAGVSPWLRHSVPWAGTRLRQLVIARALQGIGRRGSDGHGNKRPSPTWSARGRRGRYQGYMASTWGHCFDRRADSIGGWVTDTLSWAAGIFLGQSARSPAVPPMGVVRPEPCGYCPPCAPKKARENRLASGRGHCSLPAVQRLAAWSSAWGGRREMPWDSPRHSLTLAAGRSWH